MCMLNEKKKSGVLERSTETLKVREKSIFVPRIKHFVVYLKLILDLKAVLVLKENIGFVFVRTQRLGCGPIGLDLVPGPAGVQGSAETRTHMNIHTHAYMHTHTHDDIHRFHLKP